MGIINAFGKQIEINYDFEAKSIIREARTISTEIKGELVLLYSGFETISFAGLDRITSDDIMHWIFSNRPNTSEYQNDIRGYLLSVAEEDTAWTKQRNEGFTGIFYRKIKLHDDIVNAVCGECDSIIEQAQGFVESYQTSEREMKKAAEERRNEIMSPIRSWTTEEKNISDEGGKTTEYIHHITVGDTEMVFTERNVFDFGRVVNYRQNLVYAENGVYLINTPNGKEKLNDVETKAVAALFEYGKYARAGVRM